MRIRKLLTLGLFLWVPLSACAGTGASSPTSSPFIASNQTGSVIAPEAITSPGASEAPTQTPPEPTWTPRPLAAQVDGMEITLAEYEAELAMYQEAAGRELTEKDQEIVLNDLIDQALLAKEAIRNGFELDDAALNERMEQLITKMGGNDVFETWMAQYNYDENTFGLALQRSLLAAWMRDQITSQTPKTAEQIHVRQILTFDQVEAENVLTQLNAGDSFDNLAVQYDPITGGDLGWFPRGFIPNTELEEAAFDLELNEYSPVIQTPAGFHILLVVERDPQHPLAPGALLVYQANAIQEWLETQRKQSDIKIFYPDS